MEQMTARPGMHFTDAFGSQSTKTAGGMHLPAPVSKRKVFSAARRWAVARIADPPMISTPLSLTIIRRLPAKPFNVSGQSARRLPVNPADDLVDDFLVYTADLVGVFLVNRADVMDPCLPAFLAIYPPLSRQLSLRAGRRLSN
jgi:hypothetical protein